MSGSISPSLGEIVRFHRVRAGLSQEALAEASGVSIRTISDLERGQRLSSHLETLRLLAAALDLSDSDKQALLQAAHPPARGASTASTAAPTDGYGVSRWAASLPAASSPLVGRSRELDRLLDLLQEPGGGIVTVSGTGGVGKTRLAIEAAHRLAPTRTDGALFVNLATLTDAARVPDAIAQVLGLSLQSESIGSQLLSVLSSRDALLVLDNFEHVVDAAPAIAELDATCARLTILVTSRVRLRLSLERELALSPLPLADAADGFDRLRDNDANALFAARARRVDPDFALSAENAVAVTGICRRLEGLPLAIELAASRLRILTIPALLERLDRRLPLLTGGDRDMPPRQQSMRATIAWSYDLLTSSEQRFLRWSAVFVGGLSLESAEALGAAIGLGPFDALEAVSTLLESGFAYRTRTPEDTPRISLFDTIREFGWEQLEETGEVDAARHFHAVHFLEFASRDAPRPDQLTRAAWIWTLTAEHANLIPAFDTLCTPPTARECLRFAAAMSPYWDYCGPYSEAQPRLNQALALAPDEPTIPELHTRCWMSFMLAVSSDEEGALAAVTSAIALADRIGSPGERLAARQSLAMMHEYQERFDLARDLMEEVMIGWASVGNTLMHASCLMYHAGLEYARGNLDRAMDEAARARLVFEEASEFGWAGGAAWYQGMIAMSDGSVSLAAIFYEQSIRIWIKSEIPWRWFKSLIGLADAGAAAGCYPEASRLLGAADELISVTGTEIMPFDAPGYARAETRCRDALGDAVFAEIRSSGHRTSPDVWLEDASVIVARAQAYDAARVSSGSR